MQSSLITLADARYNTFGRRFVAAAQMENTGRPVLACTLISPNPLFYLNIKDTEHGPETA